MRGERLRHDHSAGVLVGLIAGGSPGTAPESLLRVFARVAQARPALCGVLIGEPERLAECRLLARRLPCGDRLVFAHARKALAVVRRTADFLVLPLGGEGGDPETLAEVMRRGAPAVLMHGGAWVAGGAPGVMLVPEGDEAALEHALLALADRRAPRQATDLLKSAGRQCGGMPPGEGWPT